MRWVILVLVLWLSGFVIPLTADAARPSTASAEAEQTERVLDYDVHVRVDGRGTLHVRERIKARVESSNFRSGFTRAVKNQIRDGRVWRDIHLTLDAIRRDGADEHATVRLMGRNAFIQIGAPKTYFEPGIRTWELNYRVGDQIHEGEFYDELSWSVIGDNWRIPVDNVRVTVEYPEGITIVETNREINRRDGNESEGQLYGYEGNSVTFEAPRTLVPSEELRVQIKVRKGTIDHTPASSEDGDETPPEGSADAPVTPPTGAPPR